jgi:hypothetical protein
MGLVVIYAFATSTKPRLQLDSLLQEEVFRLCSATNNDRCGKISKLEVADQLDQARGMVARWENEKMPFTRSF